jgi:hypothetical protein
MQIKGFDVYFQMCILADEIQSVKNRIGWFDQYDYIINKQTGTKLIGLQLIVNKYDENTAWMPTQAQIINMILQLQSSTSLVVEDFEDWYKEDKEFFERLPYVTFEMLYLMYYMERYNRKFWCWGCGFWKDISEKKFEIKERIAILNSESRIIADEHSSEE